MNKKVKKGSSMWGQGKGWDSGLKTTNQKHKKTGKIGGRGCPGGTWGGKQRASMKGSLLAVGKRGISVLYQALWDAKGKTKRTKGMVVGP